MENDTESHKSRKAECNQCGGIRNCTVHGVFEQRAGDEHFNYHKSWYLLQCKGCDYAFVQTIYTDSESYRDYYENGEVMMDYEETHEYWPAISSRRKPDWFDDYGVKEVQNSEALTASLAELYGALDANLNMLAAIGVRTTFDIASELLGIDPNIAFKDKIENLQKLGHIGLADKDRIRHLVDAGSASAHRGWKPTNQDLKILMDVLEHFVENALVAPAKKAKLDAEVVKSKKNVPARPKKEKKSQ